MADGKVLPGDDFSPPPAPVWNNMIDAGAAWARSQRDQSAPNPIRPRETDIIKVKNTSGAARRLGEILRISGKAIETVTDENKWLLGVEPTDDGYFGILKEPAVSNGLASLQVSGCCMALVNVTDADHKRATPSEGEYVLQSGSSGPIELLFAPDGTGEKTCVVRFGGVAGRLQAILIHDLAAAVNTKRDPSTATARILRKNSDGDLELSGDEKIIVNRFERISVGEGTYVKIEHIDGEWQLYAADCPSDGSSSESL